MSSGRNRFPFTASQWQELEYQALIFKYMVSGIPIPSDLLFTLKRNSFDSSTLSSNLLPRQPPHGGWSCLQMGLGRKLDPEPGRCKRTDGKKWRCSREAYPDSKYCEKHMHRGKSRSRKSVEVERQTTAAAAAAAGAAANPAMTPMIRNLPSAQQTTSRSLSLLPPEQNQSNHLHYPPSHQHAHLDRQFLLSSSNETYSKPCGILALSPQDNPISCSSLHLEPGGSCSRTNANYRGSACGMKLEEIDEHSFFTEPRGSIRSLSPDPPCMDNAWQFTQLPMSSSSTTSSSSSSSSKQRNNVCSLQNEYSYLKLQTQYQQHVGYQLVAANDVRIGKEEAKKTVHHFFDEWSPKNKEPWLDLDDQKQSSGASTSTTKLSISIPSSSSRQHSHSSMFN